MYDYIILYVWFGWVLFLDFLALPFYAKWKARKRYIPKSSYYDEQQRAEFYIRRSGYEKTFRALLRATTKTWMYIILFLVSFGSILVNHLKEKDLDIVLFMTACIALLESVDSYHLAKEKEKEFKHIDSDVLCNTWYISAQAINAHASELLEEYNKLSAYEKIMNWLEEKPLKGKAVITVDGKKQKCKVGLKRNRKSFMLEFPQKVKYVDKMYASDTANYTIDANTIVISKTNSGKAYTININIDDEELDA